MTFPAGSQPAVTGYRQRPFRPPPDAADLLLIRHGESEPAFPDAPFALVDGHADPELAPGGRRQAELIADRLADAGIQAIYVTTLRRTSQTAAPLADRLALTPAVEAGLREVHLGEWEAGLYRKMIADRHPIARQMWEQERWDVIPGAEDADAFAARVGAAITRIAAAHAGQRVAVFTHGGVIGQALALAARSRPFAFAVADNGSISRLVVTDERWLVRLFNDTAHLRESGSAP